MARSRLRESQMLDADVLTEGEHAQTTHYFKDLGDVTTVSGNEGKYLRVDSTASGIEYVNITGSVGVWKKVSANYTAEAGDNIFLDSTVSGIVVTLPSNPNMGDAIAFIDGEGNCGTNNVTVARNGKNIMGLAEDFIVDTDDAKFNLVYYETSDGWRMGVAGYGFADWDKQLNDNEKLYFGTDADMEMYSDGTDTIMSGTQLRIIQSDTGGNPINANAVLSIERAGANAYIFVSTDTDRNGGLLFGDSDDANGGYILYSHDDGGLWLRNFEDGVVSILNDLEGSTGSFTGHPTLRLHQLTDQTYDIDDIHGEIQFYTDDAGGTHFPGVSSFIRAITTRGNGVSYPDTGLSFGTTEGGNNAPSERMRIYHDGIIDTPDQSGVWVALQSDQSIPNTTWTTIEWDYEYYDIQGDFNTTNHRFTAPVDGKYLITAKAHMNNINDSERVRFRTLKNGTADFYGTCEWSSNSNGTADITPSLSCIMDLDADDYITFEIRHTHGAARDLEANWKRTFCMIQKIA